MDRTEKEISRTNKIAWAIWIIAIALILSALWMKPAHGQQVYTIPQTISSSNFWNLTDCSSGNLTSSPFQNYGQSVSVLSYQIHIPGGALPPFPAVDLEGSNDGTNWFQISANGVGESGIIVGYGQYPYIRAQAYGGNTGCEITASYSGTSVAPSILAGQADSAVYEQTLIEDGDASVDASFNSISTPYGSTSGFLAFDDGGTGGPPAGSSIEVDIVNPGSDFTQVANFSLAASAGVQLFEVPAVANSSFQLHYPHGGASTTQYTLSYVFFKPGTAQSPLGEKTLVINTALAGPTQIIAAASTNSVRIVSVTLSSGTAEAIDLQQGTGSNCGTGNSQLTGLNHLAANTPWNQTFPGGGLVA